MNGNLVSEIYPPNIPCTYIESLQYKFIFSYHYVLSLTYNLKTLIVSSTLYHGPSYLLTWLILLYSSNDRHHSLVNSKTRIYFSLRSVVQHTQKQGQCKSSIPVDYSSSRHKLVSA